VPRRRGAWTRLQDHFHTHPQGRLHEFLFWAGSGLVLGVLAFAGWRSDKVSTPIALILAIVAACLVLWSFLPQAPRKEIAPRPSKSRRR
jgi:hypothetical protein